MPRPEQSLHPFDSVHRPDLRASDAEREQVVETLRSHGAEGRLGPEELSERLDEAYASSTLGQLSARSESFPSVRRLPARSAPGYGLLPSGLCRFWCSP